jgi:hypothetical protein
MKSACKRGGGGLKHEAIGNGYDIILKDYFHSTVSNSDTSVSWSCSMK